MEIPDIPLEEEGDTFQTVMAILIAIVTLVGGVMAWRATVAGGNAGDADFAGLHATLNAEETLTLNNSESYRHYRAYTYYTRNDELQDLIEYDLKFSEAADVERQRAEAAGVAATSRLFFPARYLNRDGSYATQRELGEAWAEAGQALDLDPEPHFAEADQLRTKTNWLVAIFMALSLSLLFYTLAEGLHPERRSLRYAMAITGTLFLLITIGATVAVELLL
jgi:hypothetical protein